MKCLWNFNAFIVNAEEISTIIAEIRVGLRHSHSTTFDDILLDCKECALVTIELRGPEKGGQPTSQTSLWGGITGGSNMTFYYFIKEQNFYGLYQKQILQKKILGVTSCCNFYHHRFLVPVFFSFLYKKEETHRVRFSWKDFLVEQTTGPKKCCCSFSLQYFFWSVFLPINGGVTRVNSGRGGAWLRRTISV